MEVRRYTLTDALTVIIHDNGAIDILGVGPITHNGGEIGASTLEFGSGMPQDLAVAAAMGTSLYAAREDHRHRLPSAADVGALPLASRNVPGGVAGLDGTGAIIGLPFIPSTAAHVGAVSLGAIGQAGGVAPLDLSTGLVPAVHLPPTGAVVGNALPLALQAAPLAGTSEFASHQDHVHALPSAAMINALDVNARGTAGGVAPLDLNGFIPEVYIPPLVSVRIDDESDPSDLAVAPSPGLSTLAAPADHVHRLPTPVQIGAVDSDLLAIPNGVATLDADGTLTLAQVPAISFVTGLPIAFTVDQRIVSAAVALRIDNPVSSDYVYAVENIGYTDLYLGHNNLVSPTTGWKLYQGDVFRVSLAPGQALWIISSGGDGTISVMAGQ